MRICRRGQVESKPPGNMIRKSSKENRRGDGSRNTPALALIVKQHTANNASHHESPAIHQHNCSNREYLESKNNRRRHYLRAYLYSRPGQATAMCEYTQVSGPAVLPLQRAAISWTLLTGRSASIPAAISDGFARSIGMCFARPPITSPLIGRACRRTDMAFGLSARKASGRDAAACLTSRLSRTSRHPRPPSSLLLVSIEPWQGLDTNSASRAQVCGECRTRQAPLQLTIVGQWNRSRSRKGAYWRLTPC